MPTVLEQLKTLSTVVADTGDLQAIQRFRPQDATTNPSLILKAVKSGDYDDLIDRLISPQRHSTQPIEQRIAEVSDQLIVTMGKQILQEVPGRVSTEVDARLSFDMQSSLNKARHLVDLYEQADISRDRILIKLAATWEGISAAEILELDGIQCNLTLIFNFAQARACAEAGAYLISPFVGRILDWHRQATPDIQFAPEDEPGVLSVRDIYHYFRQHDYPTIVMGASFRNTGEILALAGCDRLTISPALLEELAMTQGSLSCALRPPEGGAERPKRMTESEFRWQLNEDAMATQKLAEGIRGFAADQRTLENLLKERLEA